MVNDIAGGSAFREDIFLDRLSRRARNIAIIQAKLPCERRISAAYKPLVGRLGAAGALTKSGCL
jgi:hypothetical protein